jgi:hypothetical protein
MAARTALCRSACVAAALLGGCTSAPPEAKAPQVAAAVPVAAPAPAAAAAPAPAPVEVQPQPAPKKKAPPKKRAPKPKPPAPEVVKPAPPPPPPPPNPEEERKRKLDIYVAALRTSAIAFNPPSPVQIGQRVAVTLSVTPPQQLGLLADDLRKSLDPGSAAWSPRMRVRLSGNDFAIEPGDAGDPGDAKDLSASGRTDWRWTIAAGTPGSKKLVAALSFELPPGLGGPRDLLTLQRAVEVEATLSWRAQQAWADYWQWIIAAIALATAAIAWLKRR